MTEAAILTMLVPGSVWERKGKKKVTEVTVLAVTNQELSAEILEEHPQQVVFVTERMSVLSLDIESFLKGRNYSNMNEQVEELMNSAVAATADVDEDDEEEGDFDKIQLPEDQDMIEVPPENNGVVSEENGIEVNVYPFRLVEPHPLAQMLAEAFVSYTQSPWPGEQTLHTLTFLTDDLAQEDLEAVFIEENRHFEVNTDAVTITLGDAPALSVGLEVRGSSSYGVVHFLADAQVQSQGDSGLPVTVNEQVQAPAAESNDDVLIVPDVATLSTPTVVVTA